MGVSPFAKGVLLDSFVKLPCPTNYKTNAHHCGRRDLFWIAIAILLAADSCQKWGWNSAHVFHKLRSCKMLVLHLVAFLGPPMLAAKMPTPQYNVKASRAVGYNAIWFSRNHWRPGWLNYWNLPIGSDFVVSAVQSGHVFFGHDQMCAANYPCRCKIS